MKVLVTGATGFIGNYVIAELLKRKISVVATSSSVQKAREKSWFDRVTFVEYVIKDEPAENLFEKFNRPDIAIHLAWGELSNFKSEKHLAEVLPQQLSFLKNLLTHGLKDLTCTGTCLEYGMQEGELNEKMDSAPTIAYPMAKNNLRKELIALKKTFDFSLKWVRLFYMYGDGQAPKSILPLLDKALDNNEQEFNMSAGEQVRDYMPVNEIAQDIVILALQKKTDGIINCSSNNPITIRQLVEAHLKKKGKSIRLNLGFYPYTDYEPMRFWGNNEKMLSVINTQIQHEKIQPASQGLQREAPLVSICIPVYNGEKYIDETIQCCLNQTYSNIEIIVSDNCSTDGTVERIKSYNDPRIRIFSNAKNEGLLYNFGKVLTYAGGKYLSFLGADDGMEPEAAEKAVKIMEAPANSDIVLVNTFMQIIDDEGKRVFTKKFIFGGGRLSAFWAVRANLLYGSNTIGELNGTFFRSDAYNKIPEPKFKNANIWAVDLDLKFELLFHGNAYVIPEALGKFRLSSQSTSVKEARFRQAKMFREYALGLYRDKRYHLSFLWVVTATINSFILQIARNIFYIVLIKNKKA